MIRKPKPRWVGCLLIVFVGIPVLGTLLLISHWRLDRPLHSFPEPTEVKHPDYKDFGPYTLHIVDRSLWWKYWERNEICDIQITREHDGPNSYGHSTAYTFHNYNSASDYFTRCTCAWEPHGVTLTEPTGHKIFIPAQAFTGGR